jgi:hypothetical protein
LAQVVGAHVLHRVARLVVAVAASPVQLLLCNLMLRLITVRVLAAPGAPGLQATELTAGNLGLTTLLLLRRLSRLRGRWLTVAPAQTARLVEQVAQQPVLP